MPRLLTLLIAATLTAAAAAEPLTVTQIKAIHHDGQTFVTWRDAAEGEAGAKYRYSLYRSDKPITQDNLAAAELCYHGVLNHSGKQFGFAFWMKDRLDPARPMAVIAHGGKPLPLWTGLAVRTVPADQSSFYAVMVTDEKYQPIGTIVPGQSATTEALAERKAPIQPILIVDGKTRKANGSTAISGKAGLPLHLSLHGSQSTGGAAPDFGDTYIYFGTPQMGWRDGLPGIFSVYEKQGQQIILFPRDAIENPSGNGVIETCWFGYYCVPQGAAHADRRAYPFTENRLLWLLDWVAARYKTDPQRVYSAGQSMGGMGSTQFAFRHPEIFAAVYPRLGRIFQSWLPAVPAPAINFGRWNKPALMDDGKSDYFADRMDAIRFAASRHDDLPFYGFGFGRTDTVDTWERQIGMVKALTANHHGFAMTWNNKGHESGGAAEASRRLQQWYPPSLFARDKSFPAFGNSSIDDDMGKGDRADGDLVGGINLGFVWKDVIDEADRWAVTLSNELATAEMTVDVTPRWAQKFKCKPGDKFTWTNTAGGQGEVTADQWGLVTVEKVKIQPGQPTTLTIRRP